MESNEKTELTSKLETDSQIKRLRAQSVGVEGSNKKEKDLMGTDNSVVTAGGRGVEVGWWRWKRV